MFQNEISNDLSFPSAGVNCIRKIKTRMHSGRMRTARLEADVTVGEGGAVGVRSLSLMSKGRGYPYHVTYPMMHLILPTLINVRYIRHFFERSLPFNRKNYLIKIY